MQNIDEYIASDVGMCDLTTMLLSTAIDTTKPTILRIKTRENLVLSGVKFARQIATKFDCSVITNSKDGDKFEAESEIFAIRGSFENIHKAWKITQILFEYSCKISTYADAMVREIRTVSAHCNLAVTRKSFPFARELCVSAALAGGAVVHRLGLYDTVLFFDNHIKVFANFDEFCANLDIFKAKMVEKNIMVEVNSAQNFAKLLTHKVDTIIADKMGLDELEKCVALRNEKAPNIAICAAGGINLQNCANFAATGADVLVTSAVFNKGVCDLSGKVELV